MSKQKYPRGCLVMISDEMPPHKSHFPKGFEGIVEYTYSQLYGGTDFKSYSIIQLKDGQPINSFSWYDESQLTMLSDDIPKGLSIIEEYRFPATDKGAAQ